MVLSSVERFIRDNEVNVTRYIQSIELFISMLQKRTYAQTLKTELNKYNSQVSSSFVEFTSSNSFLIFFSLINRVLEIESKS